MKLALPLVAEKSKLTRGLVAQIFPHSSLIPAAWRENLTVLDFQKPKLGFHPEWRAGAALARPSRRETTPHSECEIRRREAKCAQMKYMAVFKARASPARSSHQGPPTPTPLLGLDLSPEPRQRAEAGRGRGGLDKERTCFETATPAALAALAPGWQGWQPSAPQRRCHHPADPAPTTLPTCHTQRAERGVGA